MMPKCFKQIRVWDDEIDRSKHASRDGLDGLDERSTDKFDQHTEESDSGTARRAMQCVTQSKRGNERRGWRKAERQVGSENEKVLSKFGPSSMENRRVSEIRRIENAEEMTKRWSEMSGTRCQEIHMVSGGRVKWSDIKKLEDGATVQVMGGMRGGMGRGRKGKILVNQHGVVAKWGQKI